MATASSYFPDLISNQTYPKCFIGPPVSRRAAWLSPEVMMDPPSEVLIKAAQT